MTSMVMGHRTSAGSGGGAGLEGSVTMLASSFDSRCTISRNSGREAGGAKDLEQARETSEREGGRGGQGYSINEGICAVSCLGFCLGECFSQVY